MLERASSEKPFDSVSISHSLCLLMIRFLSVFAAIISRSTIESASRKTGKLSLSRVLSFKKDATSLLFFRLLSMNTARSNVSEKAEFDEISFARHSIPSAQAAAIVAFPTATPELISASFMSPAENLSRVIFFVLDFTVSRIALSLPTPKNMLTAFCGSSRV